MEDDSIARNKIIVKPKLKTTICFAEPWEAAPGEFNEFLKDSFCSFDFDVYKVGH